MFCERGRFCSLDGFGFELGDPFGEAIVYLGLLYGVDK
jgi:hypothetical protein